jgi:putative ABC transport system permease protein
MAGPINWFSQIGSITKFGLMSIPQRRGAVAATVIGIAGVVAVLVGVLSIAAGFKQAMTVSGSPDGAIVLRSGADSEMVSGLAATKRASSPTRRAWRATAQGPLASAELFVIINLPKRSTGTDANVPLRGVDPPPAGARQRQDHQGRMFEWGKDEVIVGAARPRNSPAWTSAQKSRWAATNGRSSGIFSANGGVAESEIWTDAKVLQAAYQPRRLLPVRLRRS